MAKNLFDYFPKITKTKYEEILEETGDLREESKENQEK